MLSVSGTFDASVHTDHNTLNLSQDDGNSDMNSSVNSVDTFNVSCCSSLKNQDTLNELENFDIGDENDGCKVVVENIPETMTETSLLDLLGEYGVIITHSLQWTNSKGKKKGIAFLRFTSKNEADLAIHEANGTRLEGVARGDGLKVRSQRQYEVPQVSLQDKLSVALQDLQDKNDNESRLDSLLSASKKSSAIYPFSCILCSASFELKESTKLHIETEHPDWEKELNPDASSSSNAASSSKKSKSGNIHSNANWLSVLRSSFNDSVIQNCSRRTRDAAKNNEKIEDAGDRRSVFSEIVNETVKYLRTFFGEETPKKRQAEEVVHILASTYPALFQDDGSSTTAPQFSGYGLGGVRGLKGLADSICDKYRDKARKKKKNEDDVDEEMEPKKKGKKKEVYGVNNKKWYEGSNDKNSVEKLRLAAQATDYEEREQIFEDNRPGLMKLIRNSQQMVYKVCGGFFDDYRHLQNMFYYLTNTDILGTIQETLEGHLDNMEIFLESMNQDTEFEETLQKVKDDCDIYFDGSKLHKYVHILRLAAKHYGEEGAAVMRILEDGDPKTPSPHMMAVKVGRSYVFELWVEKKRILEQLDMGQCIASFLHLAFCFDLKYPKVSLSH